MILDMFMNESNLFDSNSFTESFIEDVEAIPLSESEDIMDACFRITLENETNWNMIMNTIAISEMSFLETHAESEVMYEAVDIRKIKNTIVEFLRKAWQKLKGVFQRAIEIFQAAITNDKKLVEIYKEKVKKNPELEKKSKYFEAGKMLYNIEDIKDLYAEIPATASSVFDNLINFDNYKDEAKIKNVLTEFGGDNYQKKQEKFKMDAFNGAKTIKDIMPKLKEKYYTPVKLRAHAAAYALENQVAIKTVRSNFKDAEKMFNSYIKVFKKAKGEEGIANNAAELISLQSKAVKDVVSTINLASSFSITSLRSYYAICRSFLKAVIKSANASDKGKKKGVGESADLICNLI